MQFKFISAIVAAILAGSTLAAVLEDRQASTCGSGLAQPCGSVDLTILGIEANIPIPWTVSHATLLATLH